jgi:MFS transporter, FHS family, L-fucose permease
MNYCATEAQVISHAYLVLAAVLVIVALAEWAWRNRLDETPASEASTWRAFNLLRHPRFGWGALCIFLCVGAEVAIGSIIVNYLMQNSVLALGEEAAANTCLCIGAAR